MRLENEISMITLKCPLLENVKFKDVFYKFAQIDDMSWIRFIIDYLKSPLVLLITNVVPLLLGTFAETCSLNLPQKGRKAGHDCLWAVA